MKRANLILLMGFTTLLTCLARVHAGTGCSRFREPPVNFQGITTQQGMDEYVEQVMDDSLNTFEEFLACQSRWGDEHWRDEGASSDVTEPESEQWQADLRRFNKQLIAAAKAHMALLAAQPFKGAYNGSGMASTGGASRSEPRVSNEASGHASAPQVPSSANLYKSYDCVLIEHPANGGQKLHNRCDIDIEAHWQDTGGGWNMATIRKDSFYPGGSRATKAVACRVNDGLDKRTLMCRE